MLREMPILPEIFMPVCDVRNVALAHVNALTFKEALSNRHIIVSLVEAPQFKEWAIIS